MKNKNFNSISQFSVPQNWIDDALSIPSDKNKKKPILFVKFSRTFAAVACIVLVCCISLVLFFMAEDGGNLPVNPTSSVSINNETNEKNTEYISTENDNNDLEPTQENVSQNSSSQGNIPTVKPTTKPTVSPSVSPTIEPSEDIEPPTDTPPTEEVPTEEQSTDGPPPTEEPTWEEPTWEEPSGNPEPPSTEPEPVKTDIYVTFSIDLLGEELNLYCKILDSNGNLVGDRNLYSSEHRADMNISGGQINAHYHIYSNLIEKADYYTFVFYNRANPCIATQTLYLYP